jgi:hypothetical protein
MLVKEVVPPGLEIEASSSVRQKRAVRKKEV